MLNFDTFTNSCVELRLIVKHKQVGCVGVTIFVN